MANCRETPAMDLRKCEVCWDDMIKKSPKLLTCKHSFCLACLTGLAVQHGYSGLKITCPKCKYMTVVKSGNLANLPDNFLLQEVKEVLDDHMRHHYCFFCNKNDVEQKAVCLCATCHRYMCKDCLEKHKKAPKFQNHEILSVVKEERETFEYCLKHNEPVWYVCLLCAPARRLCEVCLTLDGACHPEELVEYSVYMAAVTQEKSNLRIKLNQQNQMESRFSACKDQLRKHMERIRANVESAKQSLEAFEQEAALHFERSLNIKAFRLAANNTQRSRNRGMELLRSKNKEMRDIQEATDEIRKTSGKFEDEAKKVKDINLSPTFEEKFRQEFLKFTQKVMRMLRTRPSLVASKRFKENISKLRSTRDGRVLFVRHGKTCITELTPNMETRDLDTEHVTEYGCDIALDVCENLYFTCKQSKTLRRSIMLYRSETQSDLTMALRCDWIPLYERSFWYISDLCVCNDCIILVWPNGTIHSYNESSGKTTCHKIPYQDGHVQLTSVKRDRQPEFIATFVTHKAVILCDTEGKELQIISKYGSPIKQPRATTINDQGNILVADSEDGKIVELTMNGEHIQDVLTKDDGLKCPVNVVYSHSYLWVADQESSGTCCLKCFK